MGIWGKGHWCTLLILQVSTLITQGIGALTLFWRIRADKEFMRCPNLANTSARTKMLQLPSETGPGPWGAAGVSPTCTGATEGDLLTVCMSQGDFTILVCAIVCSVCAGYCVLCFWTGSESKVRKEEAWRLFCRNCTPTHSSAWTLFV